MSSTRASRGESSKPVSLGPPIRSSARCLKRSWSTGVLELLATWTGQWRHYLLIRNTTFGETAAMVAPSDTTR
jgi:hypothetical protein